jgi:hypothetical protein
MDWKRAIESHRLPLIGHVLALCAKIGLREGAVVERVSKPLYREVLGILRTAESAVRRLIVAAARDIVVEPRRAARARPKTTSKDKGEGKQDGKAKRKRRFLFKLFDPPKRTKKFLGRLPKRRRAEPRARYIDIGPDPRKTWFRLFGEPQTAPPAPAPEAEDTIDDDTVDARHLIRRLFAITEALHDIPRQARRLALWRAQPLEERHPQRSSPLRVGRPPGFRQRAKHEVDEILKECHWLARNAEPQLDTS